MKKIITKIISAVLCVLLSVSAVACKKDNNEPVKQEEKVTFNGTHELLYEETAEYLVKDGKTDYVLVVDTEEQGVVKTAREEFRTLFKAATGITIPEKSASGLKHNSSAKYISIGENELFASSGIVLDKAALTTDGVRIVTKDKTIYIVGGGNYGTLYAVYDFMQITFNYEQYYLDCMEIDSGVTDKKLYNYNVTDIPDMLKRSTNFAFLTQEFKNRMRMPLYSGSYLMPIHKRINEDGTVDTSSNRDTLHNSDFFIPREDKELLNAHSGWYGDSGNVLCYTAHGNSEELELMAEYCAKKIEASLMYYTADIYPNMNAAAIGVEDNADTCTCAACAKNVENYGSHAASLILFMNKVNGYVRKWLEENKDNKKYYRENFELVFLAYYSFSIAPVHWDDSQQKYVMNTSKDGLKDAPVLKIDKGVSVCYSFMNVFEEELNIYHEKNDNGREQLSKWAAITDGLWLWTYSSNFHNYLYFHDAFSMFNSDGYQFFASKNIKYFYQNSQSYQTGASTGFHALSIYIQSKQTWNSALNTNELVDKFMNAMYKDAAPIMKRMFESMRVHNAKYKSATGYVTTVDNPSNFPYATLQNWMDMADEAIKEIEYYKDTDPSVYNTLKTHIEIEWIFPAFATLRLRSDYLTQENLAALKARFKETGLRLGISRIKEIEADGMLTAYLNSL